MLSNFKKIFINESVILSIIVINTIIIFITESGIKNSLLLHLDILITIFFAIEMIVKIKEYGFKQFWSNGWDRFDFIIVFLSIPSITTLFISSSLSNLSVILALRLLRIFRIFRVFKFFPNINQITKGFVRALNQSRAILIGFIIIIIISGLINCCLFKNIAPEYFSTPLNSIYTVFRIFTVEGWYEIPDAIALATTPLIGKIARLYFCLLLCGGGIIGLSFVNSVFVDAMAEDNNDSVIEQLNRIEKKLEELEKKLGVRN
jgi:voltage-gated sodium channel